VCIAHTHEPNLVIIALKTSVALTETRVAISTWGQLKPVISRTLTAVRMEEIAGNNR